MESLLFDELLQEIFQRLPSSASSAVPLVCKRWLILHRNCRSSLSLRFPSASPSSLSVFSSFLSRYPRLSSLAVVLVPPDKSTPLFSISSDAAEGCEETHFSLLSEHLLLAVAFNCGHLRHLRFLAGPVSPSSLLSLSSSCEHLSSLSLSFVRPFSFHWLTFFPSLKDLSLVDCGSIGYDDTLQFDSDHHELPLESLCLSGIKAGDRGFRWLWRSCTKLRRLQLRSCEGTGDGASSSAFVRCLPRLQELELRTCRSIADGVLLRLAEHCGSLHSLLLYDGGSRDGLHHFMSQYRSTLRKLDLRLPLDLDNEHLSAVARNIRGLVSLRLQSCCLVTGEGLKTLSSAVNAELEELALINCDVVEREPGLLTTLGQSLRELRKLDLSYNEMLRDKELVSMLVSCKNLVDLNLRGCRGLTGATLLSMFKSCKLLETIDIKQCCRIEADNVEFFLLNSPRLRQVHVEESKISGVAKTWASQKFIKIID
ncbi:F-box/LRR-repeat protein 4-like [Macadamia integrifolia]|uniref:F-box/LRR-repeat protein 4-like n=1 Tax=Macadamia integrifolia TaxID=60698 RepID=UPI001C4F3BD6|nr:F-box/LRR-repeat protein 4-like [Macadamia integrifolia]